ncbi:uncharacterized protein LOC125542280 [Triticum urartu]|uniref:uncharacterized protein LOC125542280 n=1 Tax=Triticum urartu TaxID=4572 RepID=UPI002044789A|nr:uncharacterized protein LOC125542280 [Triticum urartu]
MGSSACLLFRTSCRLFVAKKMISFLFQVVWPFLCRAGSNRIEHYEDGGLHRPIAAGWVAGWLAAAEIDRDANGFGCPRRTRPANNFPEEYRSRATHRTTPRPTPPDQPLATPDSPALSARDIPRPLRPSELPRFLRPRTLPIYITHTPTSRSHQNPKRRDIMVSNKQPAPQPGAIAASRAGLGARRGPMTSSLAKRRRDAGMAELSVQVAEGGDGATGGSEEKNDDDKPIHLSPRRKSGDDLTY